MSQIQIQDETEDPSILARLAPSQRDLAWSGQRKPEEDRGKVKVVETCGAKPRSGGGGSDDSSRGRSANLKSVPVGVRLNVSRKSNLDEIKDKIEKPDGRVPRTFLPKWPVMSMDNKIPYINCPYTLMYYSRGKLGENLWRKGQDYYLYDPELRNRVIGEPYNALHDPHNRSYLKTPVVKKVLLEQGLINNRGEVLCNVAQFNKFRNYLRNLYTVQVSSALCNRDQAFQNEHMQMKHIRKEISDTEGRGANASNKSAYAKAYIMALEKQRQENYALKQAEDEERAVSIRRSREEQHMLRILRSLDRSQVRSERMHEYYMRAQLKREMLVATIACKEKTAEERREQEAELARLATRQYKIEYLDSRFDYGEAMLLRQEELSKNFKEDLQKKTIRRQRRMEHERAILPEMVRKRKKAAQRLEDIVRKYAQRWMEKVRQRKKRKPDALHLSLWETNVILDETNKYLRQESGYEKLDDFILSIIKLKEEIRAQLEAEEKAESEAAAAEEDTEEEAMDESISPEDLVEDILEDIIDNATSLYASNVVENVITDFMGKVQSKCSKVLNLRKDRHQGYNESKTVKPEVENSVEKIASKSKESEENIVSSSKKSEENIVSSSKKSEENIVSSSKKSEETIVSNDKNPVSISCHERPTEKTKLKRKVRGKGTITLSGAIPEVTQTKSENIPVIGNLEYSKAKSIQSDSGFISDWSAPIEIPSEIHVDNHEKKENGVDEHELDEKVVEIFKNPRNNLTAASSSDVEVIEVADELQQADQQENLNEVKENTSVENEEKSLFGETTSGLHIISVVETSVSKFIAKSESVLDDILSRNNVFSSKSSYTDFSSDIYKSLDPPGPLKDSEDETVVPEIESSEEEPSSENGTGEEVINEEIKLEEKQEIICDNSNAKEKDDSVSVPSKPVERPESRSRRHFFDTILSACCSQVISLEKFAELTSRKKPEKKPAIIQKNLPRYKVMKRDAVSPRSKQDKSRSINKILLKAGVSDEKIASYHETRGNISKLLRKSNIQKNQSIESLSNSLSGRIQVQDQSNRKGFHPQRRTLSPLPPLKVLHDTHRPYSAARSIWSSTSDRSWDADIESHCDSEFLHGSQERRRKSEELLKHSASQSRVIGSPYLSTNHLPLKVKYTLNVEKSDSNIKCDSLKRNSVKYLQFEVPTCASKSVSNISCKNRSSSCTRLPPIQLNQLPKSRRAFYELVAPSVPQGEKRQMSATQPVKLRGTSSGTRLPTIGPFCESHLKNTEEVYKPQIRKQSSFTKLPSLYSNTLSRQESSSSFISSRDYLLKDKHSFSKSKEELCGSKRNATTAINSKGYEIIQPLVPSLSFISLKPSTAETDYPQSEIFSELTNDINICKSKRKRSSYLPSIIKQLVAKEEEIIDRDNQWSANRPMNDLSAVEALGRALLIVEHSIKRMVLPDILKYMFDEELAKNVNPGIMTDKKKESETPVLAEIAKIAFSMAKDCANYERVKGTKSMKDNNSFLQIYATKYSRQIQSVCMSVAVSILKKIFANGFDRPL